MYLLIIGIILLALKYLEVYPVSDWAWTWILLPFGLATLWWWWADWTGYTKAKAVQKENEKKQARIDKSKAALGIKTKKR